MSALLQRETFTTSRLLDFFSVKELTAQIGHGRDVWPLVAVKELIDNSLDACEDQDIAPMIEVSVSEAGITITDNGPGIPPETVARLLDYSVRVSSREAYVSPTRGAQGNALKTIVAMPFVLDGEAGAVTIAARGIEHRITCRVDRLRQEPVIEHEQIAAIVKNGTTVTVEWPETPKVNPSCCRTQDFTNGECLRLDESSCSISTEPLRRATPMAGARSGVAQVARQ